MSIPENKMESNVLKCNNIPTAHTSAVGGYACNYVTGHPLGSLQQFENPSSNTLIQCMFPAPVGQYTSMSATSPLKYNKRCRNKRRNNRVTPVNTTNINYINDTLAVLSTVDKGCNKEYVKKNTYPTTIFKHKHLNTNNSTKHLNKDDPQNVVELSHPTTIKHNKLYRWCFRWSILTAFAVAFPTTAVQYFSIVGNTILPMICTMLCDDWVFQLEKTKTTNYHFQGYMKTKYPYTQDILGTLLNALGLRGIHLSICHDDISSKKYSSKSETKICGPWLKDSKNTPLTNINIDLLQWQYDLLKKLEEPIDNRKIIWITDLKGGSGKSMFQKWLVENHESAGAFDLTTYKGLAHSIPKEGAKKVYVLNQTRTFDWKDMISCFTILENIKDGKITDDKYDGIVIVFPSPHLVVFSNTFPPFGKLSDDRVDLVVIHQLKNSPFRRLYPAAIKPLSEYESELDKLFATSTTLSTNNETAANTLSCAESVGTYDITYNVKRLLKKREFVLDRLCNKTFEANSPELRMFSDIAEMNIIQLKKEKEKKYIFFWKTPYPPRRNYYLSTEEINTLINVEAKIAISRQTRELCDSFYAAVNGATDIQYVSNIATNFEHDVINIFGCETNEHKEHTLCDRFPIIKPNVVDNELNNSLDNITDSQRQVMESVNAFNFETIEGLAICEKIIKDPNVDNKKNIRTTDIQQINLNFPKFDTRILGTFCTMSSLHIDNAIKALLTGWNANTKHSNTKYIFDKTFFLIMYNVIVNETQRDFPLITHEIQQVIEGNVKLTYNLMECIKGQFNDVYINNEPNILSAVTPNEVDFEESTIIDNLLH